MNVKVCEIVIAPSINAKINLKTHHEHDMEKAIKALEDAFNEKDIKYSIKTDGNDTKFLDESGVELAVVVCK